MLHTMFFSVNPGVIHSFIHSFIPRSWGLLNQSCANGPLEKTSHNKRQRLFIIWTFRSHNVHNTNIALGSLNATWQRVDLQLVYSAIKNFVFQFWGTKKMSLPMCWLYCRLALEWYGQVYFKAWRMAVGPCLKVGTPPPDPTRPSKPNQN